MSVLRPQRCDKCARILTDLDAAHFQHSFECNRALDVWCRCDGWWVCPGCCPDSACVTPLAAQVRAAHDATIAALEDAS